jgi:hypothetical protein
LNTLDHDKIFALQMKKAAADYRRQLREKKEAEERAERNETARRQFLMFLLFAILAASVIYHDEVDTFAAKIYDRIAALVPNDPRRMSQKMAEEKMQAVAEESKQRGDVLDEIMGKTTAPESEEPRPAVQGEKEAKIKMLRAENERRAALLAQILNATNTASSNGQEPSRKQ